MRRLLFVLLAWLAASPARAQPVVLTDIEGRSVTLEGPARRVLLGEGRLLVALALLDPDPVSRVAGWLADLKRFDPDTYALYGRRFPAIDAIPAVGETGEETFSVEQALAVRPDAAILSGGHGPSARSAETIRTLEAAGIPVVVVDFHAKPLQHTLPSIELLGAVLGRGEQASAFAAFYAAHRDVIARRLAQAGVERPKVFMEMHAGGDFPCCPTPGHGNLGDFIAFAGGHNIGADVVPGALGQLSLEHVLAHNPDIYVATGGPHLRRTGGLVLGTGVDAATARDSLAGVVARTGFRELSAVRAGRAYGLWHHFYNSPMNLLALEALSRWIHPELFADLDPAATQAEINARFLAVPFEGTYLTGLQ